ETSDDRSSGSRAKSLLESGLAETEPREPVVGVKRSSSCLNEDFSFSIAERAVGPVGRGLPAGCISQTREGGCIVDAHLDGSSGRRLARGREIVASLPESVSVPSQFNGPLDSGQGGYSAGLAASFLEGAVAVSLRRPVPLDTKLEVVLENGESVRLFDGEELVAEGRSAPELDVEVPAPVAPDDARLAAMRYRGLHDWAFRRCFVCGLAREDAL